MTDEAIEKALGELKREHCLVSPWGVRDTVRVDSDARRILRELVEGERERCIALVEWWGRNAVLAAECGIRLDNVLSDGLTVAQLEERLRRG